MNDKEVKKLFKKFKFLKKKNLPDGIKCGTGWDSIISNLFQAVADIPPPSDFAVTKVFSKMDELRVHSIGGNNRTRFAIEAAVELSQDTCESCGNLKELQKCEKCIEPPDPEEVATPIIAPSITAGCTGGCAGGCSGCSTPQMP